MPKKPTKPKPPKKPTPPTWLDQHGKKLFRRLIDRIKPDEIESLCMLCDCWTRYLDAVKQLNKAGTVVVTSTGNLRKNPAYDIAKTSLENFCRLAKLLDLFEEVEEEAGSSLDSMLR